ncbi:MAG: hypothetical protein PHP32_02995, partial [Candidatus Izemoplasmatales bacterium]|nr:hypothetical protein [Candidatus Izemoplasmatales bacterium]
YELAVDDELPHEFTILIKNEPIGVVITAVLALLVGNLIPLQSISGIGSIGFLFIFMLVNLSAYKMKKKLGGKPWIFLGGAIANAIAMGILIVQLIQTDFLAVVYAVGLLVICYILEYLYKKSEYEFKEKLIHRPTVKK